MQKKKKKNWIEITTRKTTKKEAKNCIANLYKKTLMH